MEDQRMEYQKGPDIDMRESIQNCQQCADLCLKLITYCLSKGGEHASPRQISVLQACADICQVSARAMLIESPFHAVTCGACAEICLACADECESIGRSDTEMMECAELCRLCARSCQEMATHRLHARTHASTSPSAQI